MVSLLTEFQKCWAERHALCLCRAVAPGPVYDRLSEVDLNWRNIYVAPADERWVDEQDKGSNALR